jgi:hypothetical protein
MHSQCNGVVLAPIVGWSTQLILSVFGWSTLLILSVILIVGWLAPILGEILGWLLAAILSVMECGVVASHSQWNWVSGLCVMGGQDLFSMLLVGQHSFSVYWVVKHPF